jgi:hypothetical protein
VDVLPTDQAIDDVVLPWFECEKAKDCIQVAELFNRR